MKDCLLLLHQMNYSETLIVFVTMTIGGSSVVALLLTVGNMMGCRLKMLPNGVAIFRLDFETLKYQIL